jgi:hypothetical protein
MADYSDKNDGQSSAVTVTDQPLEVRLKYDGTATSLHQKLVSRLIARRRLSERAMSRRYDEWNRVDESCRLFIDLTRQARNADKSQDSIKKEIPWARSIVVPMSYAILQVYLTQSMGIFTRRDPPIEITGNGPEDVRSAKLMNAVLAYDQVQTNYTLELYTLLQDSFKYGMGGETDSWREELGWKTKRPKPRTAKILSMLGLPTSSRKWGVLRQYNQIEAWDPYCFFPDPRVSLSKLQQGEFIGHRLWRGYLEILSNSIENGGIYFNCSAIPKVSPKQQAIRSRNRFQTTQMNLIGSTDERDKGFHAIDVMQVKLIPREWELGDGDRPEIWQFSWVDDMVVIRAHRSEYDHGQFNYSGVESNIDTHVFGNQGAVENLDGLQRFMNWKYNSHVQNVIRFLNNRMIYASQLIEAGDIENPDAAMHVRLTALGEQLIREGRMSIDQMVHQLQLTDVTGSMMKDIQADWDMAMRMSGAADQMTGQVSETKRTLGEINRVMSGASARMAMHAGMMDVQGMRPMALRITSNRQQFTDQEQYYRVAGEIAAEFGGDRVLIKPDDLYGNYDYMPKTGPEPPDPGEMAQVMTDFIVGLGKNPGLLALPDKDGKLLDIHEFVKEMLRDRKVKNVNDFYRQMGGQPGQQPPAPNVQVLPDEQVQQMQQQGNVIPMRGAA